MKPVNSVGISTTHYTHVTTDARSEDAMDVFYNAQSVVCGAVRIAGLQIIVVIMPVIWVHGSRRLEMQTDQSSIH